jgi:uncharacterized membrane protein
MSASKQRSGAKPLWRNPGFYIVGIFVTMTGYQMANQAGYTKLAIGLALVAIPLMLVGGVLWFFAAERKSHDKMTAQWRERSQRQLETYMEDPRIEMQARAEWAARQRGR